MRAWPSASLSVRFAALLLAVLMLGALAQGRPARADAIDAFVGTYVGEATVTDAEGATIEQRDMDLVIERADSDSLVITWSNVSRVDGRRDVPGVQRRVDRVTLEPSDEPGLYFEEERGSLFSRRQAVEPMQGDPVRWARIGDGRIGVYALVILPDGGYALQIYERTLTDIGLDILFQRIVDGQVVRRITGRTVRVGEAAAEAE